MSPPKNSEAISADTTTAAASAAAHLQRVRPDRAMPCSAARPITRAHVAGGIQRDKETAEVELALVRMALAGMALVGMALVGMALVGMALVGVALVGMAFSARKLTWGGTASQACSGRAARR